MLEDVDASRGRCAGIAPRDGVMTHRAAARLQESAEDRIAAVVEVDEWHEALHGLARQRLRVHTEQAHLVGTAREQVTLSLRVEEIERAALAHHRVEVQASLESLPQLE